MDMSFSFLLHSFDHSRQAIFNEPRGEYEKHCRTLAYAGFFLPLEYKKLMLGAMNRVRAEKVLVRMKDMAKDYSDPKSNLEFLNECVAEAQDEIIRFAKILESEGKTVLSESDETPPIVELDFADAVESASRLDTEDITPPVNLAESDYLRLDKLPKLKLMQTLVRLACEGRPRPSAERQNRHLTRLQDVLSQRIYRLALEERDDYHWKSTAVMEATLQAFETRCAIIQAAVMASTQTHKLKAFLNSMADLLGPWKLVSQPPSTEAKPFIGTETKGEELVRSLAEFMRIADSDGLLALESLISEDMDPYFVMGMFTAIDGYPYDHIDACLVNKRKTLINERRIKAEMIITACPLLADGVNPHMLAALLNSFLGTDDGMIAYDYSYPPPEEKT